MTLEFYRIVHLIGVFATIMSLSGLCVFMSVAPAKDGVKKGVWRRALAALHGIGLVIVLVAGFGMLAKMKVELPWPAFVWIKIVVWIAMGGIVVLITRTPRLAFPWWWVSLGLASIAAWAAIAHPGGV